MASCFDLSRRALGFKRESFKISLKLGGTKLIFVPCRFRACNVALCKKSSLVRPSHESYCLQFGRTALVLRSALEQKPLSLTTRSWPEVQEARRFCCTCAQVIKVICSQWICFKTSRNRVQPLISFSGTFSRFSIRSNFNVPHTDSLFEDRQGHLRSGKRESAWPKFQRRIISLDFSSRNLHWRGIVCKQCLRVHKAVFGDSQMIATLANP